MTKYFHQKLQRKNQGLLRNPLFYFGFAALFLWGLPFFSFGSLSTLDNLQYSSAAVMNSFFKNADTLENNDLFFNQNSQVARETPDFKIIQEAFVYGISAPRDLTTRAFASVLGGGDGSQERTEVIQRIIGERDTVKKLAEEYGVSEDTIAWENNIPKNAPLKVGKTLDILPFSGITYVVKDGDTLGKITENNSDKTHRVLVDDVIADNGLTDSQILSGEVLLLRNGIILPKSSSASSYTKVVLPPGSIFLPFPKLRITWAKHHFNAFDVTSPQGCGADVFAPPGVVDKTGRDKIGGNFVKIKHTNGIVTYYTYYGHLSYIAVKPGDPVTFSTSIGKEGKTGKATGCHVHWAFIGAEHPLAGYSAGTEFVNGAAVGY